MQFETLSIGAVQSGPSEAAISALGGGLITESSQDFDPLTNALTFVPFTDVAVGNSCTDFTTSPDGIRLAYTCPTFNRAGTILIATNNDKLYFFDVVAHLILEDFELGLLDGESIKKIRISTDGNFLLIFLENEVHDDNSKFYWMPMPAITGTPL